MKSYDDTKEIVLPLSTVCKLETSIRRTGSLFRHHKVGSGWESVVEGGMVGENKQFVLSHFTNLKPQTKTRGFVGKMEIKYLLCKINDHVNFFLFTGSIFR